MSTHCLQGLLKIDKHTKDVTLLASRASLDSRKAPGTEIRFADDLDIASDGTVYFSDMTAVQPVRNAQGHYDVLQAHAANMLQVSFPHKVAATIANCTWRIKLLAEGRFSTGGPCAGHSMHRQHTCDTYACSKIVLPTGSRPLASVVLSL